MDRYLKQRGLMPSTRGVYGRVLNQMDTSSPEAVVEWLKNEIAQRQPIGTLLPKRAMAKHVLVGTFDLEDEEADLLLPKLKGRAGKQRQALTHDQYAAYEEACEQILDPIRTILKLLPLTGMRIAEICGLETTNIVQVGKRRVLK